MFRNAFPMPLWWVRAREPMEFDIKVTKARRKRLTKARCWDFLLCGLFWTGVKFGVVDYIAVGCCGFYVLLWMSISLIVSDAALLVEESAQLHIAALELPYVDHTFSIPWSDMHYTRSHVVSRCFTLRQTYGKSRLGIDVDLTDGFGLLIDQAAAARTWLWGFYMV